MEDALSAHRFHFAFTIAYHYLFPQLTMGLGLLIVVFKTLGLKTKKRPGDPIANECARFFTKIFGLNFVMGVVTGIPMEFQFGTNWARFSDAAGGVIGQTLAMEGVFAFFLESAFLYALLFGEKKLGPKKHYVAAILVCTGSWLSGWFIICTNAFMQHPVGYAVDPDGRVRLESLAAFLTNPWAFVQYAHTMVGSVITAAFVVAGLGAFFALTEKHREADYSEHTARILKVGIIAGLLASLMSAMPTGDLQIKMVSEHQPASFAAMEGHFETEEGASIVLVGQPNMETLTIDNPIRVPYMLSLLTHKRWSAEVKGLKEFPRDEWPDNIPLLYYSYHVMVGLGTIFMALMGLSALLLWRRKLLDRESKIGRLTLYALMLAIPFPYIANTAGWMSSELGRQPWLLHGLMGTADGHSANVSAGNVLFSLLGFMGMYAMLSVLFVLLMTRIVRGGPVIRLASALPSTEEQAAAAIALAELEAKRTSKREEE